MAACVLIFALETSGIAFLLLIPLSSFSRLFVKVLAHRAGLPGNTDIYYRAGFSPRLKGGASSRLARETRECYFIPLCYRRSGDCSNGKVLSSRKDKRKKAHSNTFFDNKYDPEFRGKSQIRGFWGRDDREGSEAER